MDRNIEKYVGMEEYLTDVPGLGGRLKKSPEDFIVEERFIHPPSSPRGKYTIASVRSENWETNRLIQRLARETGTNPRQIGFAGTKDKRAVTTQLMSFPARREKLKGVDIEGVELTDLRLSNKGMDLGDLVGNSFRVSITDIEASADEAERRIEAVSDAIGRAGGFLNYFGIQRFGVIRPITHLVGKYIVRREFERAVMTYIGNPLEGENELSFKARKLAEETRDWERVLGIYPGVYNFERRMIRYLADNPEDYPGALRTLPPNLLLMFVHAYQSYFFNRIVARRVRDPAPVNEVRVGDIVLPSDGKGVPIRSRHIPVNRRNRAKVQRRIDEGKGRISAVLFGTEVELAGGYQGEIERAVLEEEGVGRNDFLIPEMPRLSSKGVRREIVAPADNLEWSVREGEVQMRFDLIKGSYATSLLREFMKADDVRRYG